MSCMKIETRGLLNDFTVTLQKKKNVSHNLRFTESSEGSYYQQAFFFLLSDL